MTIFTSIAASLVLTEVSLAVSFSAEAETIDYLDLAHQFANDAINFDESLESRRGESKMNYGRFSARTQGIVCSKERTGINRLKHSKSAIHLSPNQLLHVTAAAKP